MLTNWIPGARWRTAGAAGMLSFGFAFWILFDQSTRIPPVQRAPARRPAHLQVEEASVEARDGVILKGWAIPGTRRDRAIVLFHGIADTRAGVLGHAGIFANRGYPLLLPDLRGHGESGGERTTFGLLESHDSAEWAAFARRRFGVAAVTGFGESLGGAVAVASLASFDRVIAECAYSDFPAIGADRVAQAAPLPPWLANWLVVRPAILIGHAATGLDLASVSPIEAVRRETRPVFLIHGLADQLTPPEHSRRIRAAAPDRVLLWEVPGAGHARAWPASRAEFERRVLAFVR